MLENSFFQFYEEKQQATCGSPKPIAIGEVFLVPQKFGTILNTIHLLDMEGNNYDHILSKEIVLVSLAKKMWLCSIVEADDMPDNNSCLYLNVDYQYVSGITISTFSNILVYTNDTDGIAKVSYYCNEDAFGFPFSVLSDPLVSWLPINLKNPQLKQDDKTYVKRSGEVVVLYAKHYKEWEAESEYIQEDMHDKICTILSCDSVKIDDVLLTKSDSYEIDWDNTIKKACGQKLAKATWKMRANVTERNSNC